MNLKAFFNPKSVAVIGASADRKKLGNQILRNILLNGYKGKVYPINLNEARIEDVKAYKSIISVKKPVDLAILSIPAKFVLDEVKKCAEAGIKSLVVITAGFSEDSPEGAKLEKEIEEFAKSKQMMVLGPNCLGFINTECNLNATFAKSRNKPGRIAFVSQSGAICSAALDWVQTKPVGFSKFLSIGNQAVLTENDFFEYFVNDKKTDLVVVYAEEIKDGRRFMASVSRLAKIKPVAILKSGMSDKGAEAALSHTGSIAGSREAMLAGLRRSGAIILENLEEMFNLMLVYSKSSRETSDLFMVSNAGGPMVATIDYADAKKINFGRIGRETAKELSKKLPPIVKIKNPMDIIGDADAERYRIALETLLKDRSVNNLLVLLTPQSSTEIDKTAQVIVALNNKHKNKSILASFIGGESYIKARKLFEANGVPFFDYPNTAIDALSLINGHEEKAKSLRVYDAPKEKLDYRAKQQQMDYLESIRLLESCGIDFVSTKKVNNAQRESIHFNFPVAMKIVGANLIHKTDMNAIALGISDPYEANMTFNSFIPLIEQDQGNYCIVQPMVKSELDLIVGFRRDESFGPIIMIGFGGIYTEIFRDFATGVDDLDEKSALEMIKSLKVYPILQGARGKKSFDLKKLSQILVGLAKLSREHQEISELDINPLFMTSTGPIAADVRIIV